MKKYSPIKAIALSLSCLLASGGAYALGIGLHADKKAVAVSAEVDSTIEKVYTGGLGSFSSKTSYGKWSWSKAANKSDTRWDLTAGEEITFTYSHTDYIFHIATGIKDLYDNTDFGFWMTVGSDTTQYEDQGLYDQIAFSDLSRRVGRTDDVIIHVKNNATSTKTFTFNSRWDEDSKAYDLLFAVTKGHANFSLDNQGGTGITSVPLRRHSACPTPIPTPTRKGYVFKGYFTQTGGKGTKYYDADGKIIQSVYNFTGDAGTVINLYAYWEGASTTVTLNKNGGTGGINSVTAKYGQAMPSLSSVPTRTGYNFDGYYDAAEGGTKYYNADKSSAKNWDKENTTATLYAHWTLKQTTINFNANGGSGAPSSVTATYGQPMPAISVTPTKANCEFDGFWDSTSGGTKYYNADLSSAKNWDKEYSSVYLHAHWIQLGTSITLDKQGGVNGTNEVLGVIGETLPNITLPARSGYIFNGYYSGQNGQGTQYYNSNGISSFVWTSSATSATFYASWTIKAAVQEVIDKIDDIGTVSYPGSGDVIAAARTAYNDLDNVDKGGVSNYSTLTTAESTYASLRQQGIDDAEDLVTALGTITLEKENDIVAARAAYEALTEEQKESFNDDIYDDLVEAELRLAELKEEKAKADIVVGKIEAIGEVSYPTSGEAITAARDAYDALTNAEERGFVSNLDTLTAAENEYNKQKEDGAFAVKDLIKALGEVEYTEEYRTQISGAKEAYDALTEEQKDLIKDEKVILDEKLSLYNALHNKNMADAVIALIDAIGEVSFTEECKAKIDAASNAFNALTEEQKALVSNKEVLDVAIDVYSHQLEVKENGVEVVGKDGDLIPVNVTIKVELNTSVKAEEGSKQHENISAKLLDNEMIAAVYDVKLIKTEGGVQSVIQPSDIKEGMVIVVEIELPEGISTEGLKVLHIHSEEDIEFVENFVVENGKVRFETDKLSEFAFVVPVKVVSLPGWVVALIIIASLLVVICGAYFAILLKFHKWIKEDGEAVRVLPFSLGKKDGKLRLFRIPFYFEKKDGKLKFVFKGFRFVYRDEKEVYKLKEDALK